MAISLVCWLELYYLFSIEFFAVRGQKIISLPGERRRVDYIKQQKVCNNRYGCKCEKLYSLDITKNVDKPRTSIYMIYCTIFPIS